MTFKSKPVNGGNVCATCPHSCCGDCASNGGWLGRTKDWDLNLPIELVYFGYKMRVLFSIGRKNYFEDNGEITSVITDNEFKLALNNFVNKHLPNLRKVLGYDINFDLKKGFLTNKGCGLKREHRGKTCTHFICGVLDYAVKRDLTNKTYKEVMTENNY